MTIYTDEIIEELQDKFFQFLKDNEIDDADEFITQVLGLEI